MGCIDGLRYQFGCYNCCDMPKEVYIGLLVLIAIAIAATIIAKHNSNHLLGQTGVTTESSIIGGLAAIPVCLILCICTVGGCRERDPPPNSKNTIRI